MFWHNMHWCFCVYICINVLMSLICNTSIHLQVLVLHCCRPMCILMHFNLRTGEVCNSCSIILIFAAFCIWWSECISCSVLLLFMNWWSVYISCSIYMFQYICILMKCMHIVYCYLLTYCMCSDVECVFMCLVTGSSIRVQAWGFDTISDSEALAKSAFVLESWKPMWSLLLCSLCGPFVGDNSTYGKLSLCQHRQFLEIKKQHSCVLAFWWFLKIKDCYTSGVFSPTVI